MCSATAWVCTEDFKTDNLTWVKQLDFPQEHANSITHCQICHNSKVTNKHRIPNLTFKHFLAESTDTNPLFGYLDNLDSFRMFYYKAWNNISEGKMGWRMNWISVLIIAEIVTYREMENCSAKVQNTVLLNWNKTKVYKCFLIIKSIQNVLCKGKLTLGGKCIA